MTSTMPSVSPANMPAPSDNTRSEWSAFATILARQRSVPAGVPLLVSQEPDPRSAGIGGPSDAAVRFARANNIPEIAVNSIVHAYVSAQTRMATNDARAMAWGNFKESNGRQSSSNPLERDNYKDQINNFVGRQIGGYIDNIVAQRPDLSGSKREMMQALILDAYQRGVLALDTKDPRIDKLIAAGVNSLAWTKRDDRLLVWPGPNQSFLKQYGVADIPPQQRRQQPIGY